MRGPTSGAGIMGMAEEGDLSITHLPPDFIRLMYAGMECGRAISCFKEVERLLAIRIERDGAEIREWLSVFNAIRLALHFTANVSKLFWPQDKPSAQVKNRCDRLRKLVGLSVDHPLSNRRLRNHFEHFDERLDKWVGDSPRPFAGIEVILEDDLPDVTRRALHRSVPVLYDEIDQSILMLGEKFLLPELLSAVKDVLSHISLSKIFDSTTS